MVNEEGIPHAVLISTFEEICQGKEPDAVGMVEHEGQILFGPLQEGQRLLVSLQEVRNFIEEHELTNVPKKELNLTFFVESLNPTVIFWHVFTQEDLDEMKDEDDQNDLKPVQKH